MRVRDAQLCLPLWSRSNTARPWAAEKAPGQKHAHLITPRPRNRPRARSTGRIWNSFGILLRISLWPVRPSPPSSPSGSTKAFSIRRAETLNAQVAKLANLMLALSSNLSKRLPPAAWLFTSLRRERVRRAVHPWISAERSSSAAVGGHSKSALSRELRTNRRPNSPRAARNTKGRATHRPGKDLQSCLPCKSLSLCEQCCNCCVLCGASVPKA